MLAVDVAAISRRRQLLGALINANIALLAGVIGLFGFGWQIFGLMQSVSWLMFAHVPLLLLSTRRGRPLAIPLLLFAADAFLIEPHWLVVSQHSVPIPGLQAPLRIALIADLQTDRVGRHELSALSAVAAAEPDLILFAGDYIQLPAGPGFEAEAAALRPAL
ncbi:MAG: hypothetical protein ACI8S6_001930, partial [Myxococcota bacterium]